MKFVDFLKLEDKMPGSEYGIISEGNSIRA
jgi:hypothetical protein